MNTETCGRIRLLMSCVVFSASTVLTGCATPPVQYYPDAEQAIEDEVGSAPPPGSAVVEFTTNSVAIAVFQQRVGDKLCEPESEDMVARVRRREMLPASVQRFHGLANFMSLGNLNRIEKLPRTKITHFPAGQAIAFAATTYTNDASCGPLFLRFTPEEGKRYVLSTDLQDHICRLSIQALDEASQARPVKHSRWRCVKPFLGFGKPTLIGPNEIN